MSSNFLTMKRRCIPLLLVAVMAVSALTVISVTTAAKTDAATPNYSSNLDKALMIGGCNVITPFKKTKIAGREAYLGGVSKNGYKYAVEVFPTNSLKNAMIYRDHLISGFKQNGYRTYTTGNSLWTGVKGSEAVGIEAAYSPVIHSYDTTVVLYYGQAPAMPIL